MGSSAKDGRSAQTQGRFLRQFLVTAAGSAGAQALLLLVTPILTRLYTPAQYGIWALFFSLCFANSVFAGLRYDVAVVLAKSKGMALAAVALCLVISLVFAILVAIGVAVTWPWLSMSGLPRNLLNSLFLLPLMIVGTAASQAGLLWLARNHAFGLIAANRLIQSIIVLTIQIGAPLLLGASSYHLILGTAGGQCISGIVVLSFIIRHEKNGLLIAFRRRNLLAVARRYRKQPLFTAPYTFGTQAFTQSIVAVLAKTSGTAISGYYALAFRAFYSPMSLISTSIGQVFFPRMAQSTDRQMIEDIILRITLSMGLVFGLLAGVFLAAGDFAVPLLFGAKWSAMATIMKIMIFPSIFLAMSSWIERIFDVHGRQHVSLIIELLADVAAISGLLVGIYLLHSVVLGLIMLAGFMCLGYAGWLIAAFAIAGYSWIRLIKRLLVFFASVTAAWAFTWALSYLFSDIVRLAVAAIVLAAIAAREVLALIKYINIWDERYYCEA